MILIFHLPIEQLIKIFVCFDISVEEETLCTVQVKRVEDIFLWTDGWTAHQMYAIDGRQFDCIHFICGPSVCPGDYVLHPVKDLGTYGKNCIISTKKKSS